MSVSEYNRGLDDAASGEDVCNNPSMDYLEGYDMGTPRGIIESHPEPSPPEPSPEDYCATLNHPYYGIENNRARCFCGEKQQGYARSLLIRILSKLRDWSSNANPDR